MVDRFLDLQKQELDVRADEAALRARQEDNNKVIAEKSIAANLQDREQLRGHIERKTKIYFTGGTILVIAILTFATIALNAGHGELVKQITEIAAIFVAGFFSGYGFKATRSNSSAPQNRGEEEG